MKSEDRTEQRRIEAEAFGSVARACPLCGSNAYAYRAVDGTQMFKVGCAACGIELKAAWYRDQEQPTKDIVALWNTRAGAAAETPSEKK